MNDVIPTSNAYYPSIGGIENSLRHLAQEAVKLGLKATIVAGDIGVVPPLKRVTIEVVDTIPVIRYPLRPIKNPIFSWLNLPLSCFICWRDYRGLNASSPNSVVVARFHFNALLAVWAGFKKTRYLVPSIVQRQSGVEIDGDPLYRRWLGLVKIALHNFFQKAALQRCQIFVFSETMRSQCVSLAKNGVHQYQLVKPGMNARRFNLISDDERRVVRAEHVSFAGAIVFVGLYQALMKRYWGFIRWNKRRFFRCIVFNR